MRTSGASRCRSRRSNPDVPDRVVADRAPCHGEEAGRPVRDGGRHGGWHSGRCWASRRATSRRVPSSSTEALPNDVDTPWEQFKPSGAGGWLLLGTLALLALVLLLPKGQQEVAGAQPSPAAASLAVLAPEAVPPGIGAGLPQRRAGGRDHRRAAGAGRRAGHAAGVVLRAVGPEHAALAIGDTLGVANVLTSVVSRERRGLQHHGAPAARQRRQRGVAAHLPVRRGEPGQHGATDRRRCGGGTDGWRAAAVVGPYPTGRRS